MNAKTLLAVAKQLADATTYVDVETDTVDGSLSEVVAAVLEVRGGDDQVLLALINDLTDPDLCWFDHHGYCQAHGWTQIVPRCPHARAKELLEGI